jgi:penicillin-binding protein 2
VSLVVQRSDVAEFRRRFRWIALAMALIFLGLLGRLFQLQVLEADDNRAAARENIVRRITLATTRGIIRDRTGKVLAASRPAYNVYVVPERLDMEKTWHRLVDYLALGLDERTRRAAPHRPARRTAPKDAADPAQGGLPDAVANPATHGPSSPGSRWYFRPGPLLPVMRRSARMCRLHGRRL